jgi:hypothetical protein
MVWVYHSNFKNTFIKTTVNYQIDLDDYFNIEHFALLNGLEEFILTHSLEKIRFR